MSSLRHFDKFGCILHIHLPIANQSYDVECHWFLCAYSLKHLQIFSQYGPNFFLPRFIRVVPEFYLIREDALSDSSFQDSKYICYNHADICRILMRNVVYSLAIDSSNYYLNINKL